MVCPAWRQLNISQHTLVGARLRKLIISRLSVDGWLSLLETPPCRLSLAVNQLTNALSLLNDAAHRVIEAKSYNGWHSAYRSVGFVPEARWLSTQSNQTFL